jgi:hypothetical protein
MDTSGGQGGSMLGDGIGRRGPFIPAHHHHHRSTPHHKGKRENTTMTNSTTITTTPVTAARANVSELDQLLTSLGAALATAQSRVSEASKRRQALALAAATPGDAEARASFAAATADQRSAEDEADNLALAINDVKNRREAAEASLYEAEADDAYMRALEVADAIKANAAEIDRNITASLHLIDKRQRLYADLNALDVGKPSPADTPMNADVLGRAMAQAIYEVYGTYVEQQRIFPSLALYRSHARSVERHEAFLLGHIGRVNPDLKRMAAQPAYAPGSPSPFTRSHHVDVKALPMAGPSAAEFDRPGARAQQIRVPMQKVLDPVMEEEARAAEAGANRVRDAIQNRE